MLPSRPRPLFPVVVLSSSADGIADEDELPFVFSFAEEDEEEGWLLALLCADEDEDEPEPFLDWRAEEKMPSGTTRSRSQSIESIVLRLPSVDFVK